MNIIELLQKLGIDYKTAGQHEHARPGWIQVDCPWCARKGHYRLGINLSKFYSNCWGCGPHRLLPTLCELTGERIGVIYDLTKGLILDRATTKVKSTGVLKLPTGLEDELRTGHRKYLQSRGFDPDQIQRIWGIKGLGPFADSLSWRIWIPIYHGGEVVSWTTRSITKDHGLRYRSAAIGQEKIHHKEILYGEDYAGTSVTIHEGPFDVWAVGPGAIATFGTGYTKSQLARLTKFVVRGVCFDSEPFAQKKAEKLTDELSLFPGKTVLVTLDAKDAGSASKKEIRQLRRTFLRE